MFRALRILPAAALVATTLFGAAGTPASAALVCVNPAPKSTIVGDLLVNGLSGHPCVLDHVTVTGTVTMTGGTLTLLNASLLRGLSVSGGGSIVILNSTINGTTSLTGGSGGVLVCGNQLNGAVSVEGYGAPSWIGDPGEPQTLNGIPPTVCTGNKISGSLTIRDDAQFEVEGNTITGKNALTIDTLAGEFAGNSITGASSCANINPIAIDPDHTTPNSYTGPSSNCPI